MRFLRWLFGPPLNPRVDDAYRRRLEAICGPRRYKTTADVGVKPEMVEQEEEVSECR